MIVVVGVVVVGVVVVVLVLGACFFVCSSVQLVCLVVCVGWLL